MGRKKQANSPQMAALGKYIKMLREELGLSMHEVSRRSALTPSYISKVEAGNVFKTISAHALMEFSRAYNIPIQIILERMGLMEQDDELPGLTSYLKLKYKAPLRAVQEMEIAWAIIREKYMK